MVCSSRIDVAESQIDGSLTINGVLMHCPAFAVVDVTPLWDGPAWRGEDLLVPGVQGRTPRPRRRDYTEKSLPMVIDGLFTPAGAQHGSERGGLRSNLFYLRTYLAEGTLVTASLTPPPGVAGSPTTASVYVLNIEIGEKSGAIWPAMLDLGIPNGAFY